MPSLRSALIAWAGSSTRSSRSPPARRCWMLDQAWKALARELGGDPCPVPVRPGSGADSASREGAQQASARTGRITMAVRLEREHQRRSAPALTQPAELLGIHRTLNGSPRETLGCMMPKEELAEFVALTP